MNEYKCTACGAIGPYHLFDDHAGECMRGAPDPLPGEGFDAWSARVQEWRKEQKK